MACKVLMVSLKGLPVKKKTMFRASLLALAPEQCLFQSHFLVKKNVWLIIFLSQSTENWSFLHRKVTLKESVPLSLARSSGRCLAMVQLCHKPAMRPHPCHSL